MRTVAEVRVFDHVAVRDPAPHFAEMRPYKVAETQTGIAAATSVPLTVVVTS